MAIKVMSEKWIGFVDNPMYVKQCIQGGAINALHSKLRVVFEP
jgi:hypothetical protein